MTTETSHGDVLRHHEQLQVLHRSHLASAQPLQSHSDHGFFKPSEQITACGDGGVNTSGFSSDIRLLHNTALSKTP